MRRSWPLLHSPVRMGPPPHSSGARHHDGLGCGESRGPGPGRRRSPPTAPLAAQCERTHAPRGRLPRLTVAPLRCLSRIVSSSHPRFQAFHTQSFPQRSPRCPHRNRGACAVPAARTDDMTHSSDPVWGLRPTGPSMEPHSAGAWPQRPPSVLPHEQLSLIVAQAKKHVVGGAVPSLAPPSSVDATPTWRVGLWGEQGHGPGDAPVVHSPLPAGQRSASARRPRGPHTFVRVCKWLGLGAQARTCGGELAEPPARFPP